MVSSIFAVIMSAALSIGSVFGYHAKTDLSKANSATTPVVESTGTLMPIVPQNAGTTLFSLVPTTTNSQAKLATLEKQDKYAKVIPAKGITYVVHKGHGYVMTTPVTLAMDIYPSDIIYTRTGGVASIEFGDDAVSRLDGNTRLSVKSASKNGTVTDINLQVETGNLWNRVIKFADKNSNFSVETQTSVATVRGTSFAVSVDPKTGKEKVVVAESKVALMPKSARQAGGQGGASLSESAASGSDMKETIIAAGETADIVVPKTISPAPAKPSQPAAVPPVPTPIFSVRKEEPKLTLGKEFVAFNMIEDAAFLSEKKDLPEFREVRAHIEEVQKSIKVDKIKRELPRDSDLGRQAVKHFEAEQFRTEVREKIMQAAPQLKLDEDYFRPENISKLADEHKDVLKKVAPVQKVLELMDKAEKEAREVQRKSVPGFRDISEYPLADPQTRETNNKAVLEKLNGSFGNPEKDQTETGLNVMEQSPKETAPIRLPSATDFNKQFEQAVPPDEKKVPVRQSILPTAQTPMPTATQPTTFPGKLFEPIRAPQFPPPTIPVSPLNAVGNTPAAGGTSTTVHPAESAAPSPSVIAPKIDGLLSPTPATTQTYPVGDYTVPVTTTLSPNIQPATDPAPAATYIDPIKTMDATAPNTAAATAPATTTTTTTAYPTSTIYSAPTIFQSLSGATTLP